MDNIGLLPVTRNEVTYNCFTAQLRYKPIAHVYCTSDQRQWIPIQYTAMLTKPLYFCLRDKLTLNPSTPALHSITPRLLQPLMSDSPMTTHIRTNQSTTMH